MLEIFGKQEFSYYQAALILKKSRSAIKRLFVGLKFRDLLIPTNNYQEKKRLFKLKNPTQETGTEQEKNIYEEMMEEWEDFRGFEELR
jgi:hypothetical protein